MAKKVEEKQMAGKAMATKAKATQVKEEVPEKDAEGATESPLPLLDLSDAAPEDVLVTWQQLVALHRQWHSLTKELKEAEQALGQDSSEANYLRLRDVKTRLERVDGTEALIEGFGASSGRGARTL